MEATNEEKWAGGGRWSGQGEHLVVAADACCPGQVAQHEPFQGVGQVAVGAVVAVALGALCVCVVCVCECVCGVCGVCVSVS